MQAEAGQREPLACPGALGQTTANISAIGRQSGTPHSVFPRASCAAPVLPGAASSPARACSWARSPRKAPNEKDPRPRRWRADTGARCFAGALFALAPALPISLPSLCFGFSPLCTLQCWILDLGIIVAATCADVRCHIVSVKC
uniref:Uncharacterized protein n=1 Tax=Setaria viridis TaxID=4556 RepID=A0A4V6D767_SETVI|nr:hypothetical protein SEVIR_5G317500v2 [Setaria viridis]